MVQKLQAEYEAESVFYEIDDESLIAAYDYLKKAITRSMKELGDNPKDYDYLPYYKMDEWITVKVQAFKR